MVAREKETFSKHGCTREIERDRGRDRNKETVSAMEVKQRLHERGRYAKEKKTEKEKEIRHGEKGAERREE